jgi:hypothetical protein
MVAYVTPWVGTAVDEEEALGCEVEVAVFVPSFEIRRGWDLVILA